MVVVGMASLGACCDLFEALMGTVPSQAQLCRQRLSPGTHELLLATEDTQRLCRAKEDQRKFYQEAAEPLQALYQAGEEHPEPFLLLMEARSLSQLRVREEHCLPSLQREAAAVPSP